MNAKDLVKLIDKLVEKKLDSKIRQLIKEEVSSQVNATIGKMLVESLRGGPSTSKREYVEEETPLHSPINTNNPKLNNVLAETARNFRPLKKEVGTSLAELLDGGFDKVGGEEEVYTKPQPVVNDGTNIGFMKSIVSEGVTTGTPQQSVLGTEAVPDVLKGVFKKDFRAVMKKMDEQKKFGNSGLINPMNVLSG